MANIKKMSPTSCGPVKAVVYARYSSHNQTEQSIEGQLHDAYAFASREGYVIIQEYIDRAQSATSDDRDAFQQMIRDSEKGGFQVIIVWKLDRFARNRYDSAFYKKRLADHGVSVVSVMENIDDSPEGIILEGLLESMAEYYSANLAVNVKRGMREAASKGVHLGMPPYGYKMQEKRLVPDEMTAPVIRELFNRSAAGEKYVAIMRDFKARGLISSPGAITGSGSYHRILRNPAYVGKCINMGIEYKEGHEPLVSEDVFNAVQARLNRSAAARGAGKAIAPYLLSGKVYCGECGSVMSGTQSGRPSKYYYYYRCSRQSSYIGCVKHMERREALDDLVISAAVEYIMDPGNMEYIAQRVCEEYKASDAHSMSDITARIDGLNRRIRNLIESLGAAPAAARPPILAQIDTLSQQLADAEQQHARRSDTAFVEITQDAVKKWITDHMCTDPGDPQQRIMLVNTFINSVYCYEDKTVIFFNLRPSDANVVLPKNSTIVEKNAVCISTTKDSLSRQNTQPVYYVFVHGLCGIVIMKEIKKSLD